MPRQDYRIVTATALVRLDDEAEVRDGFTNMLVHDASLGGYVSVEELSDEKAEEFEVIIRDADEDERGTDGYDTDQALADLRRISRTLAGFEGDDEAQGMAADINQAVGWFERA